MSSIMCSYEELKFVSYDWNTHNIEFKSTLFEYCIYRNKYTTYATSKNIQYPNALWQRKICSYLRSVAFPVKGPKRISPNGGLKPRMVRASSCVIGAKLSIKTIKVLRVIGAKLSINTIKVLKVIRANISTNTIKVLKWLKPNPKL